MCNVSSKGHRNNDCLNIGSGEKQFGFLVCEHVEYFGPVTKNQERAFIDPHLESVHTCGREQGPAAPGLSSLELDKE